MCKKKRRKKDIAALLLSLMILLLPGSAMAESAQEDPTPNTTAAILYEVTTGTVLYEKNADEQRLPASMTKIMTAILVLDQNPQLEGEFTVSDDAVSPYYCSYMIPQKHLLGGEVISYEDCMRFMLVQSANDAANALAFEIGGSMKGFTDMMNAKAEELGCESTHFSDPSGLSSYKHYTSARDMVKMAEYAMQFEKFRELVLQDGGTIPPSNKRQKGFDYEPVNGMVFPDERCDNPYVQYMKGIKDGWIPQSGYCYTGCMEKDGLVWYSVVFGGEDIPDGSGGYLQGAYVDTVALYDMTQGLTAEDLKKPNPAIWITVIVIAAAVAAACVFVWRRKKK